MYFVICFDAGNVTSSHIAGLQPYTEYTAVVSSYTAIGEGPSENILFKTKQDSPYDAPKNVQVSHCY